MQGLLPKPAKLPDPNPWDRASNLLTARLDQIGDVLMTTPALRALKQQNPDRKITLLTSPAGARIARLIPEVDAVIPYEAPWMKATEHRSSPESELEMVERLKAGGYDGAVIFTVFSQNPMPAAFLTYLAEIPLRLAYSRENPYQMLTHYLPDPWPEDIGTIPHEVRRVLDLVASIGCHIDDERMSLQVPEGAGGKTRELLDRHGVKMAGAWAVVHPGASAPSRRYRTDGFAAAADILAGEHGWQIVFSGGPGEQELVEEVRAQMVCPSMSLAGELSLEELTALIAVAPVLITNNTGPAHIAAALGTPVVDIYALTNPQHTPWGTAHKVLYHDVDCKYCFKSVCPMGHHDCLRLVQPRAVAEAAVSIFGSPSEIHVA